MHLVEGGIEAQIRRVFDILAAVAHAAGGRLADTAKLNVFLVDLGHFALVNQIMAEYFADLIRRQLLLGSPPYLAARKSKWTPCWFWRSSWSLEWNNRASRPTSVPPG